MSATEDAPNTTNASTPGWVVETVLGSIIGGVVQVMATVFLTNSAGFTLKVAIAAALPLAACTFLVFWLLSRRVRRGAAASISKPNLQVIPGDLAVILEEMGITGATAKLTASQFEPTGCMNQSRRNLYFLGNLGGKWVMEHHIRAEFRHFLQRIQAVNGSVRFLLLNPDGASYQQLHGLREGNLSAEPMQRFKELMAEYPCLQVRLYDELPCFRLVFIDENILAVSRYKSDREGYIKSRFGWEAPHLIVSAAAPWSLYGPFQLYYEQLWESATRL